MSESNVLKPSASNVNTPQKPINYNDKVQGHIADTGFMHLDHRIDVPSTGFQAHQLLFKTPNWGYDDFIYERQAWQKQLGSISNDPGWFYFKVFFDFSTGAGLLGGVLKDQVSKDSADPPRGDCAIRYLKNNEHRFSNEPIAARANSLEKFVTSLSWISSTTPWFFDSITGLDKAIQVDFTNPMKDRVIELHTKPDAVDMRLTTMMDLYRYAAFDYVGLKEVIPENLRLFDMTIILFQTPLKWHHTGMKTMRRGTFQYKRADDELNSHDSFMSYKMLTFKGCEFDVNSAGALVPGDVSNEEGFQLGKNSISIRYKRCYQHTFNEWGRFAIGDDGIYYDRPDLTERIVAISDHFNNPYYYNPGAEIYKPLVDATELFITGTARKIDTQFVFGNLYGDLTNPNKEYFQEKIGRLANAGQTPRGYPGPHNTR